MNTKSVWADKIVQPSETRKTSRIDRLSQLVFVLLPVSDHMTFHRGLYINLELRNELISVPPPLNYVLIMLKLDHMC